MTILWTLGVALAVLTVWYLIRPLTRAGAATQEGYYQLIQLRDRLLAQLRELDIEIGDGNIDAVVAADERLRLEADLARVLNELETIKAPGAQGDTSSTRLIYVVGAAAIAIPLAAAALYFGSHQGTLALLADAAPPTSRTAANVPPNVMEMVARLEKRLQENPNDAPGWARLGRSYQVLGRAPQANAAYAKAYALAPNDIEILELYGAYLLESDPSGLTDPPAKTIEVIQRLHKIDPKNAGALWALGIIAFQKQDFKNAVDYWQRLMKQVPPNNPAYDELQRALDAARAQLRITK